MFQYAVSVQVYQYAVTVQVYRYAAMVAMEGSRLLVTRAASENQIVTNNNSRETSEEWSQRLPHKLKRRNRVKDWWIPKKSVS